MDLEKRYRFIKKFPDRRAASKRIIDAAHGRSIPIIVERYRKADPELEGEKYIVPRSVMSSVFINGILSKMKLKKGDALTFYVDLGDHQDLLSRTLSTTGPLNAIIIQMNKELGHIYDIYKQEDNILYIVYTTESAFG